MKLVVAIIQPTKLNSVENALKHIGVTGMTVSDAMGYARQRGHKEIYRGQEYQTHLLRKVALEIAVHDDKLDQTLECLEEAARTSLEGNIGDGKILVLPIEDAIQIDQGIRGNSAL